MGEVFKGSERGAQHVAEPIAASPQALIRLASEAIGRTMGNLYPIPLPVFNALAALQNSLKQWAQEKENE